MVGGRTCAMAANRVIDRVIDAKNPRTPGRDLPSGRLGVGEMRALVVAGAALMFVSAWMLNPLCFALAPLALVFLVGYHYTKRFTWLSHWVLGFTDGIAGAGGWIAVRGAFDPPAFVIWFALTTWIGGFDLIYACQDVEIDRAQGLHSVAARFGVRASLVAARVNHVLTALALAVLGWQMALGPIYWVGWLAVADAPAGPVLDLATGTADLAIAVRARDARRFVAGADFSEGMLRVGQAKLDARRVTRTRLLVADALALPFRDGAFACVLSAFL